MQICLQQRFTTQIFQGTWAAVSGVSAEQNSDAALAIGAVNVRQPAEAAQLPKASR